MKRYKLGEIADVIMGQSPESKYYNTEGKGLPFLQGNRTFGERYPDFDTYTSVITKKAKAHDVLMSVRAPVGAVNITPIDVCLGRGLCALRMQNGNQDYLYYLMKYYSSQFNKTYGGTIFPSINRDEIKTLIVNIVDDKYLQQRIAKILSTIDAKIELNKKISRELEAMAKELYDYWFVQFDFPNEQGKPYKSSGGKMVWNETLKREIPEGWGICKLKDYINNISRPTLAGEHLRDMFYTPIDELPKRQMSFYGGLPYTDAKSSLQLYQENDILIGAMRVYFHRVCIAAQRGITRSTTIVLQIRNVKDLAFIYELLNDDQTIQYANKISVGTQQPYVNWDNAFDSMDVILPTNLIVTAFCKKINPVIDKVKCLAKENYTLTRLRDYLLPLLMNGQIRVL